MTHDEATRLQRGDVVHVRAMVMSPALYTDKTPINMSVSVGDENDVLISSEDIVCVGARPLRIGDRVTVGTGVPGVIHAIARERAAVEWDTGGCSWPDLSKLEIVR